MATVFDSKDRRVVPNWRSFGTTVSLGELNSFQNNNNFLHKNNDIQSYVIDWEINKSIIHASELLSAAVSNNILDDPSVLQAADFILRNETEATYSQIKIARYLKKIDNYSSVEGHSENLDDRNSQILINIDLIKSKIRITRSLINKYPFNPILYIELSRYYSIIGIEDKSVKSMQIAIHLAPNNRFVLRCATRLFTHFNNYDNGYINYIHNILKKSPLTGRDPWLTSAEISLSTIKNKNSNFIKKGVELINSKNLSPLSFTELASSIGTVELLNGAAKKSRDFFNKSLIQPNDNSLAQIEWASTKDKHLSQLKYDLNINLNYEALALSNYNDRKYGDALDSALNWFLDMPFSKRPVVFASNLASTILKDQDKSIMFLKAGLISHPNDPQLINNLAFSLCLNNQINEAVNLLNRLKNENEYDNSTAACLTATRGLIYFRSGLYDLGRQYYLQAIKITKEINDQELNWIAILNYTREEIRINSEYVSSLMDSVAKIPDNVVNPQVNFFKTDVLNSYEKLKNTILTN